MGKGPATRQQQQQLFVTLPSGWVNKKNTYKLRKKGTTTQSRINRASE